MDASAEPFEPVSCGRCGGGNSTSARFCQHCGNPIWSDEPDGWYASFEASEGSLVGAAEDPSPPVVAAPIVSAVVCELSAPTMGDQGEAPPWAGNGETAVPPEIVDEVLAVLRAAGAVVEDPPDADDTMTAVFGPEAPDGDGPVRAVRAAGEIRDRLSERGVEAPVRLRAGVGTAEIVGVGPEAEDLWRQRVIDLATRLQRMADVGEVIVAEGVYRRIGGAAELQAVDPHAPRDGRGSTGPLRLVEVTPDPATATLGTPPLVGRDAERERVRSAAERVRSGGRTVGVRILGDEGTGKSRVIRDLVEELAAEGFASILLPCRPAQDVGAAAVLAALIEAVCGAGPFDDGAAIRSRLERIVEGRPGGGRIADRLLPALGLPGEAVPEETAWALGRLLEGAAHDAPLVLGIDDVDAAGPWFQELLLAATSSARAPVLVLAAGSAGPSAWAEGWEAEGVEQLRLTPLPSGAMERLVAGLLRDGDAPPDVLDPFVSAAGGDPLLAEQLVADRVDAGELMLVHRRWAPVGALGLPEAPSVRELFEQRIRDLDPDDRTVLGLLAVAGDGAPWDLIAELLPDVERATMRDRLNVLVARRLLDGSPERFGFPHLLVRELARTGLPGDAAAHAHERCGRWYEARCGDRPQRHAAAVARHLGSAVAIGLPSGASGDLARRAAGLLVTSADVLSDLGDEGGSLAALERATELLDPADPTRAEVLLRAGTGLAKAGRAVEADPLLVRAARAARDGGDAAVEARARLLRSLLPRPSIRGEAIEAVWDAAERTEEACLEAGDHAGLAAAWSARAVVHRRWGHWAAAAVDEERAADHAERAGLHREAKASLRSLALAIEDGPAPVEESAERCRAILERVRDRPNVACDVAGVLAVLLARAGRIEEAERGLAGAREDLDGQSAGPEFGRLSSRAARVQVLAGRPDAAEELLWRTLDHAVRTRDESLRGAAGAALANVLVDLGRHQEAEQLADEVGRTGDPTDVVTQVAWRVARARALAATGRPEEAREPARQALRLAEQTDLIDLRADALLTVAEVLRAEDRPNEAAPFATRAMRALSRKGATASAARAEGLLASLRGAPAEPPSPEDEPGEPHDQHEPAEPTPSPDGDESHWWSFGRS